MTDVFSRRFSYKPIINSVYLMPLENSLGINMEKLSIQKTKTTAW